MNVTLVSLDNGPVEANPAGPQKILVASLLRTLFSGTIVAASSREMPLYKTERQQVEEFHIQATDPPDREKDLLRLLRGLENLNISDWVVVCDPAAIALRNLDHLFPPSLNVPYPPPPVDFLWADAGDGIHGAGERISPAVWALRGEHLETVLDAWDGAGESDDPVARWTRMVNSLPLAKRRFETGEVVVLTRTEAVNWNAVCRAAWVCLQGWQPVERWEFLQALYLKLCLGDESGMALGVLEY